MGLLTKAFDLQSAGDVVVMYFINVDFPDEARPVIQ
jgi:hypothetical protein